VIGIGGAVLGGAGKTPVAIEIARLLARRGIRTALVGHAFRARPGAARTVTVDAEVAHVGDDALWSARALADDGVPVVVAPTRQHAIDHAAGMAEIVVVDGLLQSAPARLAAAVLVLDGAAPWGAGACPPLGDLRAAPAALRAAADHVAVLDAGGDGTPSIDGAVRIRSRLAGTIDASGVRAPMDALDGARVGVILAIARPQRVLAALRASGIAPTVEIVLGDHDPIDGAARARAMRARVDVWVTTGRCATKLPAALGEAPVLTLDHRIDAIALMDRLGLQACAPEA
jgi:tetraacyldisaccharide 4'-kinase